MFRHIKQNQSGAGVMNFTKCCPNDLLDRLILKAAEAVGFTEDDVNKKLRIRVSLGRRFHGLHKGSLVNLERPSDIRLNFILPFLFNYSHTAPDNINVAFAGAERWFRLMVHEFKHAKDRYDGLEFSRAVFNSSNGKRRPKWGTRAEEIRAIEAEKNAVLPADEICDLAQVIYDLR